MPIGLPSTSAPPRTPNQSRFPLGARERELGEEALGGLFLDVEVAGGERALAVDEPVDVSGR